MAVMDDERPAVIETSGVVTDRVRQRLLPWLTQIVDSLETEAPLVFRLAQVTNLGGDRPVRPIHYDFDRPVEDCVTQIIMAAIDDMEGGNFKTDVAYVVMVDGSDDQSFNFTLKAIRGHGHDEQRRRDYFPDIQGLTAQMMEQNLHLTDRALDAKGESTGILMKLIEMKDEEIRYLKKGQYTRDLEIQRLMDGSLKRTMMYEEHSSKLKQQEAFADGFKQMAPPIIAQLAGPQAAAMAASFLQNGMGGGLLPGFSQGPSDEDLLDDLILRLEKNPQMRDKLFEVLVQGDSEAFQVLGELHKRSVMRREQRAQEQAEQHEKRAADQNGGQSKNGGPP